MTYYGAYMFAEYYGMELPTYEEWIKAARGMEEYVYPWGNVISNENANFQSSGDIYDNGTTPRGYYDGDNNTIDSPSVYGVYDMTGNVSEWIKSSLGNDNRYILGGNWNDSIESPNLRIGYTILSESNSSNSEVGFRCIKRLYTE